MFFDFKFILCIETCNAVRWIVGWKQKIISIASGAIQFDFNLELIEMSLRIYSCVSLIVPLSNDVHLPCIYSQFRCMDECEYVYTYVSCLSRSWSQSQSQKAMLSLNCKIIWYNSGEYFIINDFTMLNNFRKCPFPVSKSIALHPYFSLSHRIYTGNNGLYDAMLM